MCGQNEFQGKVDIFRCLSHEIGHALGLDHSSDSNSIMYAIFEKNAGEQLPVVSKNDVDSLRKKYGYFKYSLYK